MYNQYVARIEIELPERLARAQILALRISNRRHQQSATVTLLALNSGRGEPFSQHLRLLVCIRVLSYGAATLMDTKDSLNVDNT